MSVPVSPWTLVQVKFFDPIKKWGYLKREGEEDIFLHISTIRDSGFIGPLSDDSLLEVQYVQDFKGLKAVNIRFPQNA